jgi:hypothetical protein
MTQGQAPRPPSRIPEWIGDETSRQDVAAVSDRGVAVKALDSLLRTGTALKRHSDEFRAFRKEYTDDKAVLMKELADYGRRVAVLEMSQPNDPPGDHSTDRPPAHEASYRAEAQSSHEWDELLHKAGTVLSQRVKDPRDRLDSNRARQIAQEVIETTKTADDALAFRSLKSRGWQIVFEILKWLAAAGVGFATAHWGLHGGH